MATTFQVFQDLQKDIPKQTIIRRLRNVFSETISKYDVITHKLIMCLEGDSEDIYERTILQYGHEGYSADERIRSLVLKWWVTGDCSSPR